MWDIDGYCGYSLDIQKWGSLNWDYDDYELQYNGNIWEYDLLMIIHMSSLVSESWSAECLVSCWGWLADACGFSLRIQGCSDQWSVFLVGPMQKHMRLA
jgi:hypothetical protein